MGMRKFGSAAPPFSKVACAVKGCYISIDLKKVKAIVD